ncbi:MAG TPA: CDP-glycerol glycerophosphotransferase family protein [Lactobacillaceae bacterium]
MATFALKIKSNQVFIKQHSGQLAESLMIRHRLTGTTFELERLNKATWKLDADHFPWQVTYWDMFANLPGEETPKRVRLTKLWKILGRLHQLDVHTDGEYKAYAYAAKGGDLSFSYRPNNGFEKKHVWMQYVALLAAVLMNIFWPFNRPWLVFEKFGSRAQDAGASFFKYLRVHQPQQRVYFLLDEHSPDWESMTSFSKSITRFGSFQHLYLLHRSKFFVSSDSNAHAYFWRHNVGIIPNLVRLRPLIFLQHGVLGFKKLDKFFFASSISAPLLFIASSDIEKEIIHTYLQYPNERIPVTGLTRWDGVQPSKVEERDTILFFYTWRPWLDDVSEEAMKESAYYQHIVAQVTSPQLQVWAKAQKKQISVVLHPKVAKMMPKWELDAINIVGDETPLRELLGRIAVLVTDYSSLAWEAYYRDIPVLFDRFDLEQYNDKVGMYMEADVPFGQLIGNDILTNLQTIADHQYYLTATEQARKKSYFKYEDDRNSERVFEAIKDMSPKIPMQVRWRNIKKVLKYFK